jgi:hypothetical protein
MQEAWAFLFAFFGLSPSILHSCRSLPARVRAAKGPSKGPVRAERSGSEGARVATAEVCRAAVLQRREELRPAREGSAPEALRSAPEGLSAEPGAAGGA